MGATKIQFLLTIKSRQRFHQDLFKSLGFYNLKFIWVPIHRRPHIFDELSHLILFICTLSIKRQINWMIRSHDCDLLRIFDLYYIKCTFCKNELELCLVETYTLTKRKYPLICNLMSITRHGVSCLMGSKKQGFCSKINYVYSNEIAVFCKL